MSNSPLEAVTTTRVLLDRLIEIQTLLRDEQVKVFDESGEEMPIRDRKASAEAIEISLSNLKPADAVPDAPTQ